MVSRPTRTLLLLSLGILLSSCEDRDDLLHRRKTRGDYVTRVRGLRGHHILPDLVGVPPPLGGGALARIMIQPLDSGRPRTSVRALYLRDPATVERIRTALRAAPAAPFRTCPPTWRIDLRYGREERVALLNLPCKRMVLDGEERVYGGVVAKQLKPLLRRAQVRPDHRVLRVRVPVVHVPRLVLKSLAPFCVEAYLPSRPPARGPTIRLAYEITRPAPSDPTQLDSVATGLRRRAMDALREYGRRVQLGRQEVVAVRPPGPIFEHFGDRVLRAKYVTTILFRYGTPPYLLGLLGLGDHLLVERVSHPKTYRVDIVFPGNTRSIAMRRVLRRLPLKPPLTPY